jgi:hypothetical protein
MEPVGTLSRLGSALTGCVCVISSAIAARQVDVRVGLPPRVGCLCFASGQEIGDAMTNGIHQNSAVGSSSSESKIIDGQLLDQSDWVSGQGPDAAKERGRRSRQGKPCPNLSTGGAFHRFQGVRQANRHPRPGFHKGGEPFSQNFSRTFYGLTEERAHRHDALDTQARTGQISDHAPGATLLTFSGTVTAWATRALLGATCTFNRSSMVSTSMISQRQGRGRKDDEDMLGKDSGLLITLVCDQFFQSLTFLQRSSSFHHHMRARVNFKLNPL